VLIRGYFGDASGQPGLLLLLLLQGQAHLRAGLCLCFRDVHNGSTVMTRPVLLVILLIRLLKSSRHFTVDTPGPLVSGYGPLLGIHLIQ
jgi:hypothetical protein